LQPSASKFDHVRRGCLAAADVIKRATRADSTRVNGIAQRSTQSRWRLKMNVHWCLLAAVCLAVSALCSLAVIRVAGPASAIVPPPGTPDLSQMALQESDFTATTLTSEGYQNDLDFAVYDRG
jgi:hypothetical protein